MVSYIFLLFLLLLLPQRNSLWLAFRWSERMILLWYEGANPTRTAQFWEPEKEAIGHSFGDQFCQTEVPYGSSDWRKWFVWGLGQRGRKLLLPWPLGPSILNSARKPAQSLNPLMPRRGNISFFWKVGYESWCRSTVIWVLCVTYT